LRSSPLSLTGLLLCGALFIAPRVDAATDGVTRVQKLYAATRYAEALQLAEASLEEVSSREDKTALREVAALAAFTLQKPSLARSHFEALLHDDPQHTLDPFVVAPPVIRLFEDVRRDVLSRNAAAQAAGSTRRFGVSVGIQQLIAFHRFVEQDSTGRAFVNRSPYGPVLTIQLRLSERWWLWGEGAFAYMHIVPADDPRPPRQWLDYRAINVEIGLRRVFPFDGFALSLSACIGSSRRFLTAREGDVTSSGVSSQAVSTAFEGGVELPITDGFGVLLRAGLAVHLPTETVGSFGPGIGFAPEKDGLLWGLQNSAQVYVRF
jgi:hypothetical protein